MTDDHEVDNNYAGLVGENDIESVEQMHARRAAAYQAWWEHQPVRVPRANSWADLVQMRRLDWGELARIPPARRPAVSQRSGVWRRRSRRAVRRLGRSEANDARRRAGEVAERRTAHVEATLAGAGQSGHARAIRSRAVGPKRNFHMDKWSGYPAATERLLGSIATVRAESHGHDQRRHPFELGERAARRIRARRPADRSAPSSSERASRRAAMAAIGASCPTRSAARIRISSGRTTGAATSSAASTPTRAAPNTGPCPYVEQARRAGRDADEVAGRARAAGDHTGVNSGCLIIDCACDGSISGRRVVRRPPRRAAAP